MLHRVARLPPLVLALALLVLAVLTRAEEAKPAIESMGWGHCATLAPLKGAPTLDGVLAPGEWDDTAGTVNFLATAGKEEPSFNAMFMDVREGRTRVGYAGDTLYIAMVSALPPRAVYGAGRHSQEMARDAELIGDFNAIEIWLDPNRDRRESRQGDQAFYQFFVNSVGSLYDAKLTPGQGVDKGWNTEVRSAHGIDNDRKLWTAEIAISLKDFGWTPANIAGRSMGMLIARNYKAPWGQPTWFSHGGPFVSWFLYPRVYFTKDEPIVAIESLGEGLWNAKPDFKVRIFNPGPARVAKVSMHLKSSDMPDQKNEKELALPAGDAVYYTYKPGEGVLHETADHLFKLRVTTPDGTKAWFDYTGMWSRDPSTPKGSGAAQRLVRYHELYPFEQKWAIRAVASPGESVGVAVYPTYKLLKVNVSAVQLVADPDGADKDKLSDSAVVTIARDGQELARDTLSWDLAQKQFGTGKQFTLKEMPAGDYTITTRFNKHPEPIVKKYTRVVFPWEGTKVGVTDKIYPPFTPVRATPTTTAVVGREYGVGDLGLWNSIKSLGKELLAGPIVVRADNARVLTGTPKLGRGTAQAAIYEATAQDDAVTVKSVCTTELDGCQKVALTLLPGAKAQELKRLTLDIPLKDDLMPLWHACTTAIRVNPVGDIPGGQGVAWDSRKFPNGDWIGNFTPYLWVGGVERGLAVFANNDRGWVLDWNAKKEFAPCQELIRRDGVLTLRLNLVQKPITLTEPRTIVLGLLASPTKPIPYPDWRGITAWGSTAGKGFEYLPKHNFSMGCAVEETFNAAYPYNRDYSIYDANLAIAGTPGGDLVKEKGWSAFFTDWKARNGLDKPAAELNDAQTRAISRAKQHPGSGGYVGMYWDEYHNDSRRHPETQVFNGEWGGNNMAGSRRDFRCYYGAETVKRGIGLYFDNTFPHGSRDLLTSEAYEIPGFGIQPSANLWEQRDYHRRIWTIHREFGAKWNNRPMSMIHMTNTATLTMLTWNDMTCDLEWFYGPEPQQSKYGLGLLQAESSGRQSGCIPYALADIQNCRTPAEARMAQRSKFGAMMVHEIRCQLWDAEIQKLARLLFGFGYGLTGVLKNDQVGETVYNYWADDFPVACDKPLVKSLLVKRGEELMLLVCSWDKDPCTARFVFDTKALGLTLYAARDVEGTIAEQVAAAHVVVEEARKRVPVMQGYLADARKKFADGKLDAEGLKTMEIRTGQAEAAVTNAEALVAIVETAAKLPIVFDAKGATLTVGLEGYGVRLVRIK
jgi:hypothetical protein